MVSGRAGYGIITRKSRRSLRVLIVVPGDSWLTIFVDEDLIRHPSHLRPR